MRALETTPVLSHEKESAVRWKRIVLGAFLAELTVIVLLSVVMVTHRFVIAPGLTSAQYEEFAQTAGYYLAAPAAALATFVFAFWCARRLESGFTKSGVLVGTVATLLTLFFILGAKPEHRLMYGISYVLRIAAGYSGGLVAQKMNQASEGHTLRQVR